MSLLQAKLDPTLLDPTLGKDPSLTHCSAQAKLDPSLMVQALHLKKEELYCECFDDVSRTQCVECNKELETEFVKKVRIFDEEWDDVKPFALQAVRDNRDFVQFQSVGPGEDINLRCLDLTIGEDWVGKLPSGMHSKHTCWLCTTCILNQKWEVVVGERCSICNLQYELLSIDFRPNTGLGLCATFHTSEHHPNGYIVGGSGSYFDFETLLCNEALGKRLKSMRKDIEICDICICSFVLHNALTCARVAKKDVEERNTVLQEQCLDLIEAQNVALFDAIGLSTMIVRFILSYTGFFSPALELIRML